MFEVTMGLMALERPAVYSYPGQTSVETFRPGFMCNSPGFQCSDNAPKSPERIENKQA
jgi:hypothetical protein